MNRWIDVSGISDHTAESGSALLPARMSPPQCSHIEMLVTNIAAAAAAFLLTRAVVRPMAAAAVWHLQLTWSRTE